ncbi:MAG: hypothetical protein H7066_19005, partial [Cytophagaceae bacterium]|nr:hypothetical protein [Gemmatimonadaceae bacterium]
MTLPDLLHTIEQLRQEAPALIDGASTVDAWTEVRTALVGRKHGKLTALMASLPSLPQEERRPAGAAINALKQEIDAALETRHAALLAASSGGPAVDRS